MRKELVDHLDKCGADLIDQLDPDNGLFPLLSAKSVLTNKQVERCRAKQTPSDRVEHVLLLLRRRADECYFTFCEVLTDLDNQHLVDGYLTPDRFTASSTTPGSGQSATKRRSDHQDNTEPVNKRNKVMTSFEDAFRGRHVVLQDMIDIESGLLTSLKDAGVLTKRQIDEIDHPLKTKTQKVEAMLQTLEQRPPEDFDKFCAALCATNQQHIRDYISHETCE